MNIIGKPIIIGKIITMNIVSELIKVVIIGGIVITIISKIMDMKIIMETNLNIIGKINKNIIGKIYNIQFEITNLRETGSWREPKERTSRLATRLTGQQ